MQNVLEIFLALSLAVGLVFYIFKQQKKNEVIAEAYELKILKKRQDIDEKVAEKIKKINKMIVNDKELQVRWEERIHKLNVKIIGYRKGKRKKESLAIELGWFENEIKIKR